MAAARSVVLFAALLAACAPEPPPRHLVLVTLDTVRRDHLGAYGHPRETSPHFDALAARGVLFEDALTQSITTTPSHASILTGRIPPRHGLRRMFDQRLADENRTLAEILAGAGFRTAAFVSALPLRRAVGLDQGFEVFDDAYEPATGERVAAVTNGRVRAWLAGGTPDRLFLWVHYFDPHNPYYAPREQRERFGVGDVAADAVLDQVRGADAVTPAELDRMSRLYDAEIRTADAALGELLALLDGAGVLDDAVVAVLADHGECLGENGDYFGHFGVREETARIPFVLVHPRGLGAGKRVTAPVGAIDLLPTALHWLGVEAPEGIDGVDLTPLIEGAAPPARVLYTERLLGTRERAVRDADWALVEKVVSKRRAVRELLDRATGGPASAGDPAAVAAAERLSRALDAPAAGAAAPAGETVPVADVVRERLEALGYVEEPPGEAPPPGDAASGAARGR